MNLNTLRDSLPPSVAQRDRDVMAHFRAAANAVATLYRSSLNSSKQGYLDGYLAALQDVHNLLGAGKSTTEDVEAWVLARAHAVHMESGNAEASHGIQANIASTSSNASTSHAPPAQNSISETDNRTLETTTAGVGPFTEGMQDEWTGLEESASDNGSRQSSTQSPQHQAASLADDTRPSTRGRSSRRAKNREARLESPRPGTSSPVVVPTALPTARKRHVPSREGSSRFDSEADSTMATPTPLGRSRHKRHKPVVPSNTTSTTTIATEERRRTRQ